MYVNNVLKFHAIWRWSPGKFLVIWPILNGITHQWPWILLRGHPRSLILSPIKSAYVTSYWSSSNLGRILLHFTDITLLYAFSTPHSYSGQHFGVFNWVDPSCWGLQTENTPGQLNVKLFLKNSNPYDNDTSTLQRDGGMTDRQRNDWSWQ